MSTVSTLYVKAYPFSNDKIKLSVPINCKFSSDEFFKLNVKLCY